jgi:uncharacterized membrane protein
MSADKHVIPLSHGRYLALALALAQAGFFFSAYLFYSHYRLHTDIAYSSFCAISKAINCDTVSQSPYSLFLGLPVSAWGAAGYLGLSLLLLATGTSSAGKQRGWSLAMLSVSGFSASSLFLAGVSTFAIGSYCLVCIGTYAVNLLLLFFTWLVRRRLNVGPFAAALKEDVRFLLKTSRFGRSAAAAFFCLFAIFWWSVPAYWETRRDLPAPGLFKSGLTDHGLPWIGAENPALEILEFADYQCFQCRKMHYFLRQFVATHPDKIRLIHCHYPMDHEVNFIVKEPCHVGSGKLALLAIHAKFKGKFWQMNDLLYRAAGSGRDVDLQAVAAELGLERQELSAALEHPDYKKILGFEIRHGMKLKVLGTPSYLIEGRIYEGAIPAEILSRLTER